jgi:hypothetical protein
MIDWSTCTAVERDPDKVKLLFDQGTPVPLRRHLKSHIVETAYELGWSNLPNGELLKRSEAEGYNALITTDQNLSCWR